MPDTCLILPVRTILIGRTAFLTGEHPAEIATGTKTAGICDFCNRHIACGKHSAGFLQAAVDDVIDRCGMQTIPENAVTFPFA